jgi:hypothetical protein
MGTKRRIQGSLAALLVAGLLVAATMMVATAHNAPNRCGARPGVGVGWSVLRAHRTSYAVGGATAEVWHRRTLRTGDSPERLNVAGLRWRCSFREVAPEDTVIRCVSGQRIVHFH